MDQLPQESADGNEREAESSRTQEEPTLRVLLVEDCPDQRRLLLKILGSAGAEVTHECNGQTALDRLASSQSHKNGFDVIVTDLQMPVLDGIEMTRRLRKEGCTIPIIMCTAETEPKLLLRAVDAGCDSVLSKSAASKDLAKHVRCLAGNGLTPTVDHTESSSKYGLKDDTDTGEEVNG